MSAVMILLVIAFVFAVLAAISVSVPRVNFLALSFALFLLAKILGGP